VKPRQADRVRGMVKQAGVVSSKEAYEQGVQRSVLKRMTESGELYRVGRGLYSSATGEVTEFHSLVEAARAVPQGVVCLLSALRFHGLTTQAPFEVWLAIGPKAWRPRVARPPLRVVRFSGAALTEGVEVHQVEGTTVRVYSAAKTVADCFKYRNKIGLDVALEALRDCREQGKCDEDELWRYAEVCRVAQVIRPYMEATL